MSAMLQRFGQWIGRNARRPVVDPAELARLAPCRALTPQQHERIARELRRYPVEAGLIELDDGAPHAIFVHSGSVQIQTRSGYVLTVEAGTPQAAYQVPLPPDSVSVYAAEPSILLDLPPGHTTPAKACRPLQVPTLDETEQRDLARLRKAFADGHCELPSLPDLAMRIGRAIDDAGNSNRDIARVIQLDPALTARLLSIVNSAAFGGLKKISTITQATTRLGRARVRSLVYSCLVKGLFASRSKVLERRMERIWQKSVHVAALSFVLGRETAGVDAEHAMLAGLTHAIGEVAVIGGLKRFPSLVQRPEVLAYAIATLRIEAGLASIRQWDQHRELGTVIEGAGHWQRLGWAVPDLLDIVNLALLHAAVGRPESSRLPPIDRVPAYDKLQQGRLTPHHSLEILEAADTDVREVRRLLSQG
jgi:HD-like signal output (HDOD) protein